MENNAHIKCSSKIHQDINANSYCQECRLYMCEKCQNMHQELYNHNQLIINEKQNEFFKGICCFKCVYEQLHKGHKLVELNDKESLKKQDLTIEKALEEFNSIFEKVSNLKNKIESEIVNINTVSYKYIRNTSTNINFNLLIINITKEYYIL